MSATYYLEYIAKVKDSDLNTLVDYIYDKQINSDILSKIDIEKNNDRLGVGELCDRRYVYGETKLPLRQYIKKVYCGREWCPRCGENGSEYHRRRMSRWWSKVKVMKEMGYLVVTIPIEAREKFKDINILKQFRKYITLKLKEYGFNRGLSRWHWAGEQWGVWNPHLNFLFEGGFIDIEILSRWREDIRRWLNNKLKLDIEVIDINYRYSNIVPKKIHWLKYVTRSTLKWYDIDLAGLLKGFRTTSTWGVWDDAKQEEIDADYFDGLLKQIEKEYGIKLFENEFGDLEKEEREVEEMDKKEEKFDPFKEMDKMPPVTIEEIKEIEALSKLHKGICPETGQKIRWSGIRFGKIPSTYKHIGGGYYVNTAPPEKPFKFKDNEKKKRGN